MLLVVVLTEIELAEEVSDERRVEQTSMDEEEGAATTSPARSHRLFFGGKSK